MGRVLFAGRLAVTVLALSIVLLGGSASDGLGAGRAASFEGGEGPVWSPDGTQIAYIGPAPGEVVSPKTGILRRYADCVT